MQIPPMRPTFEIRVPMTPETTLTLLRTLLDRDEHPVRGSGVGHHLMLTVIERDAHFWSPWLNIEVHPDPDPVTDPESDPGSERASGAASVDADLAARVEGRFSPSPAIWTGFMMAWIGLGTLAFFAAIFALAQWSMDHPPTALMLLALLAPLGAALYWVSQVGQRLARDQMHELYATLTDALRTALAHEDGSAPPQNA